MLFVKKFTISCYFLESIKNNIVLKAEDIDIKTLKEIKLELKNKKKIVEHQSIFKTLISFTDVLIIMLNKCLR